ncbi:uncharacterized protein LOC126964996 [Leptidea sinapis]|uniref:uncharacterized protein LOC126964996 n=1 Tax=Leptidea sinapis TaxID=189913 RepID=UPI0021C2DCE7|nr:uncharacterized protein LOC126964996 [Leptidea sinapis]
MSTHYYCVELTETDFKKILPMNKIKWKCPTCKGKKNTSSPTSISPKGGIISSSVLNVDTETLTRYIDTKLARFRQQLREDISSAVLEVSKALRDNINKLEQRMDSWDERLSQLERDHSFHSNEALGSDMKEENNALRTDLHLLTTKFDELDQASRSCNVEIQSIPERKGENLIQLSLEISKLLGVELNHSDIRNVHRVTPGLPTTRPKNIILQLTTRRQRDDLIGAARSRRSLTTAQLFGTPTSAAAAVSTTNSRFFINEHLTLKNKILFSKTRTLAKEKGYKYVWVRNSNILLRKKDDSRIIHVRCVDDLAKIS